MTDLRKVKSLISLLKAFGVVRYREGDFEVVLGPTEVEWTEPDKQDATEAEYEIPWTS